jgi:thiosulfate/3-mercaptopyruvate sulfurtransferase
MDFFEGKEMMRFVLAGLTLAWAGIAAATDNAIVDADFVAGAAKRGYMILWDVRSAEDYKKGHIPGAVNIGDAGKVLRNDNTEDFIQVERIEKILGAAGIDPTQPVIVYGSRAHVIAYFGLYTLRYFGAPKAYVYHDGIDGWRRSGHPVSTEETRRTPVQLALKPSAGVAVSTEEVLASLRQPDVQILDVRTPREYAGEDIRAIRGGHIPGAINIPFEQNWIDPETTAKLARKQVADNSGMSLKTGEQLKALYSKLDPDKEPIVYCQSGVRAAETATVLSQLGFKKVKVYDSSWLGYGNRLDAPAENAQFFNVGLLNGRLAGMQARIEQLERDLAEARRQSR